MFHYVNEKIVILLKSWIFFEIMSYYCHLEDQLFKTVENKKKKIILHSFIYFIFYKSLFKLNAGKCDQYLYTLHSLRGNDILRLKISERLMLKWN